VRTQFDIKHEGTLGTEDRTRMTFDENSITHLMSVLTDLYSNPTLAVIREYSTNAFDAHVAAGNPAPIEVTLPDAMSNMLVIKDYGTGMSKDDITDHFSKYGWSSKRDNDDEVGMLGLGCKSGLTYTSQFTLVTTQDGIKNTVLVTREESGGGVVQIIDTVQTDEPNGTEVQIPVKSYMDVNNTAKEFFRYWDEGTVLLNGEVPGSVWSIPGEAGSIRLDDDIVLIPKGQRSQNMTSMIVMGNVAYPVNEYKLPHDLQRGIDRFYAVIRVPIGTVNFVPSREALNYSKRSLETIAEAWNFIHTGIYRMVQGQIDAMTNAKEAFNLWQKWRYALKRGSTRLSYKGDFLVDSIPVPDPARTLMLAVRQASWSSADRSERVGKVVNLEKAFGCALHVVGHQGTAIAASTKERIRIYAEDKGITSGTIMVYPKPFGSPWMTNATVNRVRFDVIQAIKLPDVEGKEQTKRVRMKYRVLNRIGDQLVHFDILPDGVTSWVPAGFTEISRRDIATFSTMPGTVAVVLAADEKRFNRDHPTIPLWTDWAKQVIMSAPESGTDWDNFFYHANRDRSYRDDRPIPQAFARLYARHYSELMDRDLAGLMNEFKKAEPESSKFRERVQAAYRMKKFFPDLAIPKVPTSSVFKKIEAFSAFYEGLLAMRLDDNEMEAWVKAMNCMFIVKNSLHVIPVL
jgi:Histidine kinase-, DNA gyrase B-, and HSP90-like ATPase